MLVPGSTPAETLMRILLLLLFIFHGLHEEVQYSVGHSPWSIPKGIGSLMVIVRRMVVVVMWVLELRRWRHAPTPNMIIPKEMTQILRITENRIESLLQVPSRVPTT